MSDSKPIHIEFIPGTGPVDIMYEGKCGDCNTIIVCLLSEGNRQVAMTFDGARSSQLAMHKLLPGKSYRAMYAPTLKFVEIVI